MLVSEIPLQQLPHDVFNDIIKVSDVKTLLHLSKTDHIIKQLCLNDPFGKILLKFSKNPYFNPNVTSTVLNDFLNDLVGYDMEMLKRLQSSFGACLIGRNVSKQIILLNGNSNGKGTFLTLMNRLMGHLMVNGTLYANPKYYDSAYIVRLMEEDCVHLNYTNSLKRLSGGQIIYYKHDVLYDIFTIVIAQQDLITSTDAEFNKRLNVFHFKTKYVNNPYHVNEKLRLKRMIDVLLADQSTLPALLNFLLEGCREFLTL